MSLKSDVEEYGFALRRGALAPDQSSTLLELVQSAADQAGTRTRGGGNEAYAARNLLWELPETAILLADVPGSHLGGKLRGAQISAIPAERYTICAAAAGDVLLLKPLIVHRSSPADVPAHRRALHVVDAAAHPGAAVRWKRAPCDSLPD
jgi:hypothetical protein